VDLGKRIPKFDFWNPNKQPKGKWEKRGMNWYNPTTGESLHPDIKSLPPHWDWHIRNPKTKYRICPNGCVWPDKFHPPKELCR